MKKIQILPLATLLFLCFCFAQCHKDKSPAPDNPHGLPNATQDGHGLFACRINGENFIAKNNINSIGAWMSANRDTLNVGGIFRNIFFQQIAMSSLGKNRKINQTYSLENTSVTGFLYATDSTCIGGSSNVINVYQASGSILYSKIDTVNMIVSGIFNCRIAIPNCDTLSVTDGRFDITYHF